jgi:RsiW-degrading membrane proteinase PrsW (M82 family)
MSVATPAVPQRQERRALARNGLPVEPDLSQPLPKRLLKSRLFWVSVVVLLGYVACLLLLYHQVVPDQQVPGGVLPGLGREAVPIATKYALITAIPLSLLFLWADRFRPQRFWVWLMTFGWGACVATYVAADVNTWAAGHLSIIGDGDPATGARAAIFVAPFVEEAAKATVLFWLAILMRYAWVSRLSGIVLAGLSGAAFAFVENILYYGRAYRYAARTIGSVSPEQALHQTFVLRGLFTFFGHPLFTSMTGIGLAVAMRSKSKTVRIVAPLAGYLVAVLLHMSFNTAASLLSESQQIFVLIFVAVPLVLGLVGFVVRQLLKEGRLVRTRLGDYVRVGWLEPDDPQPLSRLRTRTRALWHALFTGPATFLATLRLQRAVTELAYLRDSMDRGLVDATGQRRERVLLASLRTLRPRAVISPVGRAAYPWRRLRRGAGRQAAVAAYAPPAFPGPAGLGGSFPAPGASTTVPGALGQTATRYSEVDPSWKPPGE